MLFCEHPDTCVSRKVRKSPFFIDKYTNAALATQVTGVTDWHINTDEPTVLNYDEDYNPDDYYAADAYRASDHDPVVVGLNLWSEPVYRVFLPVIVTD